MRKPVIIAIVATLLLLVSARLGWQRYQDFLQTPLAIPPGGHVYQLEHGAGGASVVQQLERSGFTRVGWEWKVLMRLEPRVYQAGEYRLEAGLRPRDLLDLLASGQVIQYRVTLVEGWTFREVLEALNGNEVLEHQLAADDPATLSGLMGALGIAHPEGWFLPETYQFTRGDSDVDILTRAHIAMQRALEQAWAARLPELPLRTPYELLTLASIIEKETALDEEREQIAGVFIRRLEKGMRLQTDPTVIYGLGDGYDGDIRSRDLKTDTPYNTYTRHGLPPTPVAMPGRASLFAAARPAPGDTLYFVADGQGGHSFSTTLEEHQAAVRKMLGKAQ
ncbi:MAG: endolytic transglycosylase MltG [Xanthomonadales bacterium]|nr:endolytic transglycosylase MltG [Xanthomonadales bacterium]